MNIELDAKINNDHSLLTEMEWLETNGLGGWASGTVSGTNARRYHGLLVAAQNPPVGRVVLVSKLAETISTADENFELDSNNFNGVIHPKGFQHLTSFKKDLFPTFYFQIGNTVLKKTIFMVYGENTSVINYEILEGDTPIQLKLKPFICARDYHWLSKANDGISYGYNYDNSILKIKPYQNQPEIFMEVPKAEFHYAPDWYFNYNYQIEQDRVQDFKEDLFTYGHFSVNLKIGEKLQVVISTQDLHTVKSNNRIEKEIDRKTNLLSKIDTKDDFLATLLLAADQYIVRRGENLNTIIAGYHWFSDWGRDTMISLPGLCLETGRYDDAKKIIKAFANVIDKGMIPNRFPDLGDEPEYNNVDGTLWYFVAIYQYILKTNDWEFIKNEMYDKLVDIIYWHEKGTRFGIKVDEDGLLMAGETGSQLTWMDAKVGDWVVTPRIGKPVEINALWYNVMKIMAFFATEINKKDDISLYNNKAEKTAKSFAAQFIDHETETLFDFITNDTKNSESRPNQIFVLSLPFELVDKKIAKNILKHIEDNLLTSRGLRSLSPDDTKYRPFYVGDQLSRDGAYHQGTVWSWLIGPYLLAKMKIQGKTALPKVKKWFEDFQPHFREAGIGQISEIFDATSPFKPKGCMAQAWSVAEILRAYLHYKKMSEEV
ncbi:MAG: amylo-alpha-1,6-glucosidase [Cytophagales bacterium]